MTACYIALPIVLAVLGNIRKWSKIRLLLLGVMSLAVTSGLILYASESKWRKLEKELYAYDIDGNGSFSNQELGPEAIKLRDAYTADTSRGMGPVIKGFLAMVYTAVCFLFIGFTFKIRIIRQKVPNDSLNHDRNCEQDNGASSF